MSSVCFLIQDATEEILLRVTNVCAECYTSLNVGDTIYYDMQSYRYFCHSCQENFCEEITTDSDIVDTENGGLFS